MVQGPLRDSAAAGRRGSVMFRTTVDITILRFTLVAKNVEEHKEYIRWPVSIVVRAFGCHALGTGLEPRISHGC